MAAQQVHESRPRAVDRVMVPPDAGLHGQAALLAISGIMAVVLLAALDQTIVGTALPRVIAELGGFAQYAWVATAYLLTSTVMVPMTGKLGDLYGRKPFLLASIIIFVGASALAGAAQTMLWLIVARGMQGVGAGMLMATAFTSVSDMFPQPERRARWQGLITSTFGIASVVGPSLGGFMTDTLGWRSVFYVNLPIGALAFTLIWLTLPADLSPRTPHARIDWAGAALITAAISALLLAVEWGGGTYAWSSPPIIGLLAIALIGTVAFGFVERRAPEPLLPLDLFQHGTILLASLISLIIGFALFALVYYTPLLLQGGLGLSPSQAGALQTPLAVATAAGSLTAGQLFARIRRLKAMMLTGAGLCVAGSALLLGVNATVNPLVLSAELALAGFGVGMLLPMITILVQSIVPRNRLGVGTATIQFLRLIGSTVGTAIVGAVVTAIFTSRLAQALAAADPRLAALFRNPQALVSPEMQAEAKALAAQLGPDGAAQLQQLGAAARGALISGIHAGYWMAFVGLLITLMLVLLLRVPDYRVALPRDLPPEAPPVH